MHATWYNANCIYNLEKRIMFERIAYRLKYRYYMRRRLRGSQSWKYAENTRKLINKTIGGVGQEARETEEMAQAFFRLLANKLNLKNRKDPPGEEEVKQAIEQLKDVGRLSIFATISIIPGGGFSLIGLELLARKFGVNTFTFIPSSFRKQNKIKETPLPSKEKADNKIV